MNSVLVVDDEIILLEMFEKILTRFGYDVQIAQTGDEALRLFESKDYSLVITDVIMPEIDGNFILNYVRNSGKDYIPVIGMTGRPTNAERETFDVVLSKPFSVDTLVETVQKYTCVERAVPAEA